MFAICRMLTLVSGQMWYNLQLDLKHNSMLALGWSVAFTCSSMSKRDLIVCGLSLQLQSL